MTWGQVVLLTVRDVIPCVQPMGRASTVQRVVGAPMAAASMDLIGTWSYFSLMGSIHFGLAIFIVYRMMVRPSIPAEAQGPLVLLPETATATVVSLNPETKWIDSNPKTISEELSLEQNAYFPEERN